MDVTSDKMRKPVPASQRVRQTPDEELAAMKATATKITSSKARSIAFLQQVGMLDAKGKLAKPYR